MFLSRAAACNRQVKNTNPQGLAFPKYLIRQEGRLEALFKNKAAAQVILHQPAFIQRYIVPEHYQPHAILVLWRRIKRNRVFSITSRTVFKTRRESADLISPREASATPFVVSWTNLSNTSVSKEISMTDEIGEMVQVVRQHLLKPALKPTEVLEEMLFAVMKGFDEKYYATGLLRARVSESDQSGESILEIRPPSSVSLADIMRDESTLERLNCHSLPYISLKDMQFDNQQIYMNHVHVQSPQLPYERTFNHTKTTGLDEVADKLDKLKRQSSYLKYEFGVVRKVDFSKYPREFLPNVINRLYFSVIRDQRLAKFYSADRVEAQTKLESSVKQAVERGTSRFLKMRMHKIHQNMGITDRDFDQYLRYFTDAMREEGAEDEDLSETMSVLGDFRSDVVILKKSESEFPEDL